MTGAELTASSVSKSYGTSVALKDVSIAIPAGGSLGVIGESGSGKSTLTRMLLGIEGPDRGTVSYGGHDIWTMNRSEQRTFRRSLQVVFQDPMSSLNPNMRIVHVVAEPLRLIAGLTRGQIVERVVEVLEEVGLDPSALRRFPHEFSGGQRQRIAIARAIAVEPSHIIFDEPISGLDVSIGAQILALVREIHERRKVGYLFVSHNLAHVRNLVEMVAVMSNGQIVEFGATDEVFKNPQHDYTRELIAASPSLKYRYAGE